jgi:lipopolysaccharide export system protein LptC
MRLPGSSVLLPLLVLGMLAAFTFWLEQATRDSNRSPTQKLRHDPDFWVDEFILRSHNPDGSVQHTLKAERMNHFPDDDTTEVLEPRVAYFRDGQTTTLTARHARLSKEGEHVRLEDEVRLVRTDADGTATLIETRLLNVIPDEEQAYTSTVVTMTQGHSVIRAGGGMEVDNKARTTVLNGPVTGTIHREKLK